MAQKKKTALIIGAGPAGLSAAYELLQKTDIKPILIEKKDTVGGMCVSVPYHGNYMDVGGHRYFTKFERIKKWWLQFLPLQTMPSSDDIKLNRDLKLPISPDVDPEKIDDVMLKRYIKRKFNMTPEQSGIAQFQHDFRFRFGQDDKDFFLLCQSQGFAD